MEIKDTPIEDLKPAKYNPRKMSQSQMGKLIAGMREFGIVEPIVINSDMTVIGGHKRLEAAKTIGMAVIPTLMLELTAKEEKALNLALNKISGEWDTKMLGDILGELENGGMLELTGFDPADLEKYVDKATQQALERKMKNETEYQQAEELVDKMIKRLTDHIRQIAKRHPADLNKAMMVVIEKGSGNSVILLADPNTRDLVTELKRYAEAGSESPLEMLTEAVWTSPSTS